MDIEAAERNALGLLQVLLRDALAVMRNQEYSPDARSESQRVARNIISWNTASGPLVYSREDVVDTRAPLRVLLGPGGGSDASGR